MRSARIHWRMIWPFILLPCGFLPPVVPSALPAGLPVRMADSALVSLEVFPAEERAAIRASLSLIDASGPFPYRQDGAIFSNREGLLPSMPQGYYREYTVLTAGVRDRGARRIVTGRGGEVYYTDDHYRSFWRLR
jgi:ribonuclease T1